MISIFIIYTKSASRLTNYTNLQLSLNSYNFALFS